ncbi:MAG TPA: hypothetical protein VGP20_04880 [Steroidobacteraceae bacterium]|nr:hypothetical protein [Steroidobacteraceae bacterium]
MPAAALRCFVAQVPAPLAIGKVLLANGEAASGFRCEAHAVQGALDITDCGGWRAYLARARGL